MNKNNDFPNTPNVVIVLAKCRKHKQPYGIRIEEKQPSVWLADWAFIIQENKARKEGYDRSEIQGTFGIDPAYPGCPYCHSPGFFKCGCGKVACWDGETPVVTCPWCNSKGKLTGAIDNLSAGGDR
jgi:hypothetical protein